MQAEKKTMTEFLILLLTAVTSQLTLASPVRFQDCGSSKGSLIEVHVDPCDSNPCTLYKGRQVTLKLVFNSKEHITDAKAVIHGIILGIPVPFPLEDARVCPNVEPACPLDPSVGKYTYTVSFPVKHAYPSTTYVFINQPALQNHFLFFRDAV
ncbi:unnamed protein product [Calicophoron daubneyi]|uniref:MD-2-related lipid-recognition domain-containing protein n=1 Tax=Calicophoron daubneyi TaxID=300641 RepID=A0AAV2THJ8_CALDB